MFWNVYTKGWFQIKHHGTDASKLEPQSLVHLVSQYVYMHAVVELIAWQISQVGLLACLEYTCGRENRISDKVCLTLPR